MAAVATEKATSLRIRVETGTTAAGAAKISNRTISNINPEAGIQDVYEVGAMLAALQTYPLSGIQRADTCILTEEA